LLSAGAPYTANKFGLCILEKELAKTHSHNSFYIFPKSFMILRQELLDAAFSLWTNIIAEGIMITNMMLVSGIEPGLPTMSL
jgi:hypothetical protein